MTLDQKRWLLLLVSCIINLFAGSIYAWSVFASPLAERIGSLLQTSLTSADLAIAFSIANALGPIPMIFGGLINDRFGPKFVIAAGGISMGFGLYASGNAESVSELIVFYGLFFGTGLSLVYGCTINNTLKFFLITEVWSADLPQQPTASAQYSFRRSRPSSFPSMGSLMRLKSWECSSAVLSSSAVFFQCVVQSASRLRWLLRNNALRLGEITLGGRCCETLAFFR